MTTALKTWILTPRLGHLAQLQVRFAPLLALHVEVHTLELPRLACVVS